ncbi:MAG TPA: uroporphyrinogen-III synthase [Aridibacter sp.]|nr:uroporphyrinogen-III synthase [Aridibacter sp.]
MRKVLVIRDRCELTRILEERGFAVENLPLVETVTLDDLSDLEERLDELDRYHGIFVTSSHAAAALRDALAGRASGYTGRVFALGRQSLEILREIDVEVVIDKSATTVGEMLENLGSEEFEGKRILFVRGNRSMRTIPEFLEGTAVVDEVEVYATTFKPVETDRIVDIKNSLASEGYSAICFFSPSGVESFARIFGREPISGAIMAAIGKTTAGALVEYGLRCDLAASDPSAETLAEELAARLERRA